MGQEDGAAAIIRTPDQRLRVFVSSTLGELAAERAAARAAIERLRLIPVMFELGARPHAPAQLYRAYLEQSHVFIGIYWQRYGWVAPDADVSGLEDEFLLSAGMPRLMYIKQTADEREPRLAQMLGRLADKPDASYRSFSTAEELADLIEGDLAILLTERFEESQSTDEQAVTPKRNTPPIVSSLLLPAIGRDREIDSITAMIKSGVRLITITGIGGVGKSRVAYEVMRAIQSDFEEVRFLRLGDLVDPALVFPTIAAALGLPVGRAQTAVDAVIEAIGENHVLVVLDNMEQLVDAGEDLVAVLRGCPRLHVIVTSRQVLRLRGEHEQPLAPLGDDSAVALFVEHAQAARPSFELDSSNRAAVTELCRRLDGLPLAIELVATRVRLFSPEVLLERLGDKLLLVTSGRADLPDRQRTLQATLDWSHRLLAPNEQALFASLAVFTGGAALDAIEAVCDIDAVGDVMETLVSLLEKSLLISVHDASGGPRVGMLQTVRAYAWEQLTINGDLAATRSRHASWFVHLAKSCDPALGPGATSRWAALNDELPNLRAAVAWLTEQNDTAALAEVIVSLWPWFWTTGQAAEAHTLIETVWRRTEPFIGDIEAVVTARLCLGIAVVRFGLGDYVRAAESFRQALDGFRSIDDQSGAAEAACMLAAIVGGAGDRSAALELANYAATVGRSLNLDWGLAQALIRVAEFTGQDFAGEPARELLREALEIAKRIGEQVMEAQVLVHLAMSELNDGNLPMAGLYLIDAVACCRQTRVMDSTAMCLQAAAAIAFAGDRAHYAAMLFGAADGICERLEIPIWPSLRARRIALHAALMDALGEEEYAAALGEGRAAEPFSLFSLHVRPNIERGSG